MSDVVAGRWVAAGDNALALDPLSGTGTWVAFTGSERIAAEILERGSAGPDYVDWWRKAFEREQYLRWNTYARAASQFGNAPFWKRRLDEYSIAKGTAAEEMCLMNVT